MDIIRKYIREIPLLTSIMIVLYGLWKIDIGLMSILLFLLTISILYKYYKKKLAVNICSIEIAILFVIIVELVTYWTSIYKPNSFYYIYQLFFVLLYYIYLKINVNTLNKIASFYTVLNYCSAIISIIVLLYFVAHYYNLKYNGFEDVSQFRYMYWPLGYNSNDWSTLNLIFISISLLPVVKNKNKILNLILFAIILFAGITTQSRGFYLAIAAYFAIFTAICFFFKIVKWQNLIRINAVVIVVFAIFFSLFPESAEASFYANKSISHRRSIEGRIDMWKSIPDMLKQGNIISGIGARNFPIKNATLIKNEETRYYTDRISNTFLLVLVEKGLLGILAYSILFIILLASLIKQIKHSQASESIYNVTFLTLILALMIRESTFSSIFENGIHLIIISAIISTASTLRGNIKEEDENANKTKPAIIAIIIVIMIVSSVIIYKNINIRHAKEIYEEALKQDKNNNRINGTISMLKRAVLIDNNNAVYYSALGLLYEKAANSNSDIRNIIYNNLIINNSEIKKAIAYYESALKLNPDDSNYNHNLAWLYLLNNNASKAGVLFNKAAWLEPNEALYHISKGIYNEIIIDKYSALNEYKKAIYLSPDIVESMFFKDLEQRYPEDARQMINEDIAILERKISITNDIILKAKLAKLYLFIKRNEESYTLLKEIVSAMPNLGRPWLYLGEYYSMNGDSSNILKMYKKSAFINRTDYYAYSKIANYYYQAGDNRHAVLNMQKAVENWKNIKTEHSLRSQRMYNIESYNNDIIPNGLLQYCKPYFDWKKVNESILKIYAELGDTKSAEEYKKAKTETKW